MIWAIWKERCLSLIWYIFHVDKKVYCYVWVVSFCVFFDLKNASSSHPECVWVPHQGFKAGRGRGAVFPRQNPAGKPLHSAQRRVPDQVTWTLQQFRWSIFTCFCNQLHGSIVDVFALVQALVVLLMPFSWKGLHSFFLSRSAPLLSYILQNKGSYLNFNKESDRSVICESFWWTKIGRLCLPQSSPSQQYGF